jgi:predicted dienelactone hydrolase
MTVFRDKIAAVVAASLSLSFSLSLGPAASAGPARSPPPVSATLPDGPDLSAPGAFLVGVLRLDLIHADQPDPSLPLVNGHAPHHDRTLPLTVWFPAASSATAQLAHYHDHQPGAFPTGGRQGAARLAAQPVRGGAFPLVIFSHGYRGWATGFADLAEGLASRGYVVAAIDHQDLEPGTPAERAASLAAVVALRSADQRFVVSELARRVGEGPLAGVYDPGRAALIGYSMGGFGAVVTAGSGFAAASPLMHMAPDGVLAPFAEGAALEAPPPQLKAVVLFAPWGGSEPLRAWAPSGLARIAAPTLVVVGDHDDVSGYEGGVRWIYDQLSGTERWLLVYQNARHNIVGDGLAAVEDRDFAAVERFEEPVWRRDRILAVNRHFVTAFLDKVLKGDAAHGAYLAPPTEKADAGQWPLAPDARALGRTARPDDPDSKGYWPGFQRRWALGLELHHAGPQSTASTQP